MANAMQQKWGGGSDFLSTYVILSKSELLPEKCLPIKKESPTTQSQDDMYHMASWLLGMFLLCITEYIYTT